MKTILSVVLLIASHAVGAADADGRHTVRSGSLRFGSLLDSEIAWGCGCSFRMAGTPRIDAPVLQWELDEAARMHVNGKLIELTVEDAPFYADRVGEKAALRLRSNEVTAEGWLTSTRICRATQPSCEVTEYRGSLKLETANGGAVLALDGDCGC